MFALSDGRVLHFSFDLLACLAAMIAGIWQKAKLKFPDNPSIDGRYIFVLLTGCVVGGYVFGTLNIAQAHRIVLAHSVLGALTGAIITIEIYKVLCKIKTSTGAAYALPFCVSVAVGRIGCFLAGMDDLTYGTPTQLPWGVDFGDGILRHPVQLYEAATMAWCALICIAWAKNNQPHYIKYAFPTVVGLYGLQRFMWEFLKPYAELIGRLNLFHLLCILLIGYSSFIVFRRSRRDSPSP